MNDGNLKKRLLAGALCWLGASPLAWAAEAPAAPEPSAAKRHELSAQIQALVKGLDVNRSEKFLIDIDFSTFHGMYAYRELTHWALALPPDSPERRRLLGLVRAGLNAVVRDSGLGLPLPAWLGEGAPVGLLYLGGFPRYAGVPDFSAPASLKWQGEHMKRQVAPEPLGQSLAMKALFIGIDGGEAGKRFDGLMLASALAEFRALEELTALGGTPEARYMPALLQHKDGQWQVVNGNSGLYGQMSLLQGLAGLYSSLAGPGGAACGTQTGKTAEEWRAEVLAAIERVFKTTVAQHFDAAANSFVGGFDPRAGRNARLGADDAGYVLGVLAELTEKLPPDLALREEVMRHLGMQADYVATELAAAERAPRAFLVGKKQHALGTIMRLDDQLAIVTGLLAAERATGKAGYGQRALELFAKVREGFWSKPAGIFRNAPGSTVSAYDGHLFGLALALWRQLGTRLPGEDTGLHGANLIESVLFKGGLLQAEGPAEGEPRPPEAFLREELSRLLDEALPLPREEQVKKITASVRAFSDQNNDGVPGSRFAGAPFGGAPVLITQTSVRTPFEAPPNDPPAPPTKTRSSP